MEILGGRAIKEMKMEAKARYILLLLRTYTLFE